MTRTAETQVRVLAVVLVLGVAVPAGVAGQAPTVADGAGGAARVVGTVGAARRPGTAAAPGASATSDASATGAAEAGIASALGAPPVLTLDEAAGAALATYPSLTGARAEVERAQAGRADARAAWLPSLSLDAGVTRYQDPMVVAPLHGLDFAHPPVFDNLLAQGALSLGWTVFDGARGARGDRARALEGVAQADVRGVREQVLADVARAYLRVGATREVLQAHDRSVAALEAERDRAAKVLAQGRAARVTLLRAEASLAQAQAEREAARMDVEVAERDLARLMGVAPERVVGVPLQVLHPPRDTLPQRAELVARARRSSPLLEGVRQQAQAARSGRAEARALWLPRVQLLARLSQYGSDHYSPTREWQGGLQLSYPLFTGGSRLAARERSAAEIRSATAGLEQTELGLESGIDQALAAVRSARARVAALTTAVAQAAEVERIEKLALTAGSGVQTDYLTAEAQLLSVRASLTQARAAESTARVELARVTGQLSRAWLRSNLESQP